ncbi:MAG: GNAT family N-acetyltransferase [Betaproteobacteria bacterium]|nr:GNAT family N-acetyltransferase [Betaproteobacteria bacterium]
MRQEDLSHLRPDSGASESSGRAGRYRIGLAGSESEVQEAQALRYQVFANELGARLPEASTRVGLDIDHFDAYCDHLIVRDTESLAVVGTYRILPPHAARAAGGYYAETEFQLGALANIRDTLVEVGRSCVHPDHRSGAVMTLLWAGLAAYMRESDNRYLAGCASIGMADGGLFAASVYKALCDNPPIPNAWRVAPRHPARLLERFPNATACPIARMPPLIKGYMRVGAHICGEPAWDADFNTADLFLLLPMERMSTRYTQHFRMTPAPQKAA